MPRFQATSGGSETSPPERNTEGCNLCLLSTLEALDRVASRRCLFVKATEAPDAESPLWHVTAEGTRQQHLLIMSFLSRVN